MRSLQVAKHEKTVIEEPGVSGKTFESALPAPVAERNILLYSPREHEQFLAIAAWVLSAHGINNGSQTRSIWQCTEAPLAVALGD